MIALGLCQLDYQVLLIIYLKFTANCIKGVKKEWKLYQCVILYDLKIISYIINARNVRKKKIKNKKNSENQQMYELKIFQIHKNFVMETLDLFCY